jgi:hypothetical protein
MVTNPIPENPVHFERPNLVAQEASFLEWTKMAGQRVQAGQAVRLQSDFFLVLSQPGSEH